MNKSLNNKPLEEIFSRDFPNVTIEYKLEEFGGSIHVFLLKFISEDELENDWRKISNAIAVYFQSKIEDDFGKWNTYIFFQSNFEPSNNYRNLKYKIEKDIFSSRKIMIEEEKDLDTIIDEHILSKNLNIDEVNVIEDSEEIFEKNKTITNVLKNKTVRGKNVNKAIAKEVLNNLFDVLKEESNEI